MIATREPTTTLTDMRTDMNRRFDEVRADLRDLRNLVQEALRRAQLMSR